MQSYTRNYISVYLWQGVSIILNMASMFIVLPFLTKEPTLYGIYSICIAVITFYQYGDLGFLNAGNKFASEAFARGGLEEEVSIIGFISFWMICFSVVCSILLFALSLDPTILFNNIAGQSTRELASKLFLILSIFTPVIIFQKIILIIFGIRVEEYKYQKINIAMSVIKIFSIFYFFGGKRYDIIGYFLFTQFINLIVLIIATFYIKLHYNYKFSNFVRSLKFSATMYNRIKSLAYSTFVVSIMWLIYFEVDQFFIAKYYGPKLVAIYALGFAIANFMRSIFGTIYQPFGVRINHFIGVNDISGLKTFIKHIIITTLPLVVFPIVVMVIFMKPLILSYVGDYYSLSITITSLLLLNYILSAFSYPAGSLIIGLERIKELYFINAFITIAYWAGVLSTLNIFGILAFPIFKLLVIITADLYFIKIVIHFMGINPKILILDYLKPIMIPLVFLIISSFYLKQYLPLSKDYINIAIISAVGGTLVTISIIIYYYNSKIFRIEAKNLFQNVFLQL